MNVAVVSPSSLAIVGTTFALVAAAMLPPRVASATPPGAQRGTEVDFVLRGERLASPTSLCGATEGLEVLGFTPGKNAQECTVRVRVAADAPLGAHPVRLCTAGGLSNSFSLFVGELREVAETRNGDAPMPIAIPCVVGGEIRGEETDVYVVELQKGARCVCEVEAMRLGRGPIDVAISVRDPKGTEIARVDDTALGHKDPWLSFVANDAGSYEVRVEPSFADRLNVGAYRLHAGDLPRPTAVTPAAAMPGSKARVVFVGEPEMPPMDVDVPADASGWIAVWPRDARGTSPTPVWLHAGPVPLHAMEPSFVEASANATAGVGATDATSSGEARQPTTTQSSPASSDAAGAARPAHAIDATKPASSTDAVAVAPAAPPLLPYPCRVSGVVRLPEGVRYRVAAKKGEALEFRVHAIGMRSPLDPVIGVRNPAGSLIAGDDDAGAPAADAYVRVTAQQDGELLVTVRDHLRAHSEAHAFVLVAAPQEKPMQTRLVVARAQEPVVTAPQGAHGGMVLQLENADYDAGLALFLQGLPNGVTAQFGAVKKGQNTVPVVVAAATDAPIGAALAEVRMRAEKEPIERVAGYAQVLPLVTVRNDQPIWTTTETRMPVSVAAPAPFSIAVRAPSVPVVRGAPLLVPVEVKRRDGPSFDVRVKALWTPTGVSSGEVTIPANATEAMLPLDASASAPLGPFSLAVRATCDVGGEGFELCSSFCEVAVAPPWITATCAGARGPKGADLALPFTLTRTEAFPNEVVGDCTLRLLSLPRGVVAEPVVTKCEGAPNQGAAGTFTLRVAADAAQGRHKDIVLEVRVAHAGSEVTHRMSIGEVRIDEPKKRAAKAPAATEQAGGAK